MAAVSWSLGARTDLRTIREFYERLSTDASVSLKEIQRQALLLRDFPRPGRVVPEYGREDLDDLIVRDFRSIYQVSEDVNVLAIVHGSRELSSVDLSPNA